MNTKIEGANKVANKLLKDAGVKDKKSRAWIVIVVAIILLIAWFLTSTKSSCSFIFKNTGNCINGSNNTITTNINKTYSNETKKTVFKYLIEKKDNYNYKLILYFGTTTQSNNEEQAKILLGNLYNEVKPKPTITQNVKCDPLNIAPSSGIVHFIDSMPEFYGLRLFTFYTNCVSKVPFLDEGDSYKLYD